MEEKYQAHTIRGKVGLSILAITVHGTWGRGILRKRSISEIDNLSWYDPKSVFCEGLVKSALRENLTFDIRPFAWSGKNSVLARDEAAKKLAEFIESSFDRDAHSEVVVIGHSHGGSVALCCLKYIAADFPLQIVTLATPFLNIRPIDTKIPYNLFAFLFGFSFAIGASQFFSYFKGSVLMGGAFDFSVNNSTHMFLVIFGTYVVPFVAGLVGFLTSRSLLGLLIDRSISDDSISPNVKAERLSSLAEVPESYRSKAKLLVLRGIADEAALTLAAGTLGTRITQLTMVLFSGSLRSVWERIRSFFIPIMERWAHVIVPTVFVLSIIVALVGAIYDKLYGPKPGVLLEQFLAYDNQMWIWSTGTLFAFSVPLIAVMAIYSSRLFMAAYGTEFLLGAGDCEVVSESVPDWEHVTAETISSGDPSADLRHKLYEIYLTPITIAAWMISERHGKPLAEMRAWIRSTRIYDGPSS